jgi:hypothetical protein
MIPRRSRRVVDVHETSVPDHCVEHCSLDLHRCGAKDLISRGSQRHSPLVIVSAPSRTNSCRAERPTERTRRSAIPRLVERAPERDDRSAGAARIMLADARLNYSALPRSSGHSAASGFWSAPTISRSAGSVGRMLHSSRMPSSVSDAPPLRYSLGLVQVQRRCIDDLLRIQRQRPPLR